MRRASYGILLSEMLQARQQLCRIISAAAQAAEDSCYLGPDLYGMFQEVLTAWKE